MGLRVKTIVDIFTNAVLWGWTTEETTLKSKHIINLIKAVHIVFDVVLGSDEKISLVHFNNLLICIERKVFVVFSRSLKKVLPVESRQFLFISKWVLLFVVWSFTIVLIAKLKKLKIPTHLNWLGDCVDDLLKQFVNFKLGLMD